MDHRDLRDIYEKRFDKQTATRKDKVWKVLCRDFFQKYVQPTDTVLDIGAGQCEFINNIECQERVAVDLNPMIHDYARDDVQVFLTTITDLTEIEDETIDVVFASNIFEHLPDKTTFVKSLREIHRVLRRNGHLLILQPNIRVLGGKYWDFLDHSLPLTDLTLVEALNLTDFKVLEVRRRFLPYTSLGRIPSYPWLVQLYLLMPFFHALFGKQAWVVGEKA